MTTPEDSTTTQNACPHPVCGTTHEENTPYTAYSTGNGLARFFQQLARLLQLLATFLKTYNKSIKQHYIVVVDEHTEYWKAAFVNATMSKVVDFYKTYKIEIKYTIDKRSNIRSVPYDHLFKPSGGQPNIFLVDEFSDCKNCSNRGYENKRYLVTRYYTHNGQPSPFLWTSIAHEIGHQLGLDHGGTLANLMNEMGPDHEDINRVKLTICQVAKVKR